MKFKNTLVLQIFLKIYETLECFDVTDILEISWNNLRILWCCKYS